MRENRILNYVRMNKPLSLLSLVMFLLSLKIWFMDFPIETTDFSEIVLPAGAPPDSCARTKEQ